MQTWIHLKKESSASLALSSWCVYQPIEASHSDDDPLVLFRRRDDVHVNFSQPNDFIRFERKSLGYEYLGWQTLLLSQLKNDFVNVGSKYSGLARAWSRGLPLRGRSSLLLVCTNRHLRLLTACTDDPTCAATSSVEAPASSIPTALSL